MQKWEYQIVDIGNHIGILAAQKMFNKQYGNEGWELVSVDNGIAYFKRPVEKEKG